MPTARAVVRGMRQVYVDVKRDAVLLPIYGLHVPFHIATVKTVSQTKSEEGSATSVLRIGFNVPTPITATVRSSPSRPSSWRSWAHPPACRPCVLAAG